MFISTAKTDAAFDCLIARATDCLNAIAVANPSYLKVASASEVEAAVCEAIKAVCEATPFNPDDVKLVSGARFPDIVVARRFGVEVKSTAQDHWTSTGSSIVETTRDPAVDRIVLMFAKLGGNRAEFICRPYNAVLKEIAVTHCPRYLIDMELADGESIFDKMGTDYDSFRTSGKAIPLVRDYYRRKALAEGKKGMPWWLGDAMEDSATTVTVGFWKDLPAETRQDYQARMFALFPEVLRSDFDNASLWLVTTKSVLNAHIRDTFTAGGAVNAVNGEPLAAPLPQIFKRLLMSAPRVRRLLDDADFLSTEVNAFNPALLHASRQPASIPQPSLFDSPADGQSTFSATTGAKSPFEAWLDQITNTTGDSRLRHWILSGASL